MNTEAIGCPPLRKELVGTDLEGTFSLSSGATVCISGRTFAEYDHVAKAVASQMPLYIRGHGTYGDRHHAGGFKALMINELGVTKYFEDDPLQADIIRMLCPFCEVVLVTQG